MISHKNMKKTIFTIILAALTGSQYAIADEGMWMINAIDSALEKKMQERGLKLSANEIYNADADGAAISDAVVSLDFGCTGSIISDRGLLITNHHCAYSDVHRLSSPEHNYLEEGFWAMSSSEEVCIKGKGAYMLKRVLDVTEEVEALKAELDGRGMQYGIRKLSHIMETRYKKTTGLDAWLSSMWKGSKYYMALYEVYRDVRLVAAPPVTSAAFGGDTDNWEWPQHKCDFAMYRIYTAPDGSPAEYSENNIPLAPKVRLEISLDGYKEGDFTMVIGYPGHTDRYSSSYGVRFSQNVKLPISNRIRGEQMAIVDKWMNEDQLVRLKYSDWYFGLSNVQELYSGQEECCKRFRVADRKAREEAMLQEWILSDSLRKERWGNLLENLHKGYSAVEEPERQAGYYRETLIRGARISNYMRRAWNSKNPGEAMPKILEGYDELDMRVEHDLLAYAISEYVENVSEEYYGQWQKEAIGRFTCGGKCDTDALTDWMWNGSMFTSEEGLAKLRDNVTHEEIAADHLCRFMMEVGIQNFKCCIDAAEGNCRRLDLNREYTQALYQMRLDKGEAQYPDANSTMRLSYGTVGGIEPKDGIICDWKTTPAGILEKYDMSDYEFMLEDRQHLLYNAGEWGRWGFGQDGKEMYVNFLTDNDITGGNSGSPVLNAEGRLIGLAFDGNKESLSSDVWCAPGYNKCVCVDIRFILWTLDRYAGMNRIITELGF